MEFIGTHFAITLGAWRVRFSFAIEDGDAIPAPKPAHHLRMPSEETFSRRAG